MLVLDHLALSSVDLAEGVAFVEAALGVKLAAGGQHPHMATHNRLLGLGDLYLEVIATDPARLPPPWPRWFDLDRFSGPPRLTNWVARCDDLEAEVALGPVGIGVPVALSRGDFRWKMAVPADGRLPFDGSFPALIQWIGSVHPASALPDHGIRLRRLEITHPDADALKPVLARRVADRRVIITTGPATALRATFATPTGPRVLE